VVEEVSSLNYVRLIHSTLVTVSSHEFALTSNCVHVYPLQHYSYSTASTICIPVRYVHLSDTSHVCMPCNVSTLHGSANELLELSRVVPQHIGGLLVQGIFVVWVEEEVLEAHDN